MPPSVLSGKYTGRQVVVTGGLGFIGSNLALRLSSLGAKVRIIDSTLPGCGANPANIPAGTPNVSVVHAGICQVAQAEAAVRDAEVIFNLAGEVSHVHSMINPARDLEQNTLAHQHFLQIVASARPGVRVVYAGTRQVYGAPQCLPVDESHPVVPVDYNGVHKYAAEHYHLLLTRLGKIDAVVLRLTNIYGPKLAVGLTCQGFLGAFFRKAATGQPIDVFGDGEQLRDPVYVDDAVDAFLAAGIIEHPTHRVVNIGSGAPVTLLRIATKIAAAAGSPAPRLRAFPAERKKIDIGSYHACPQLASTMLGWKPRVELREGIARTIEYLRAHPAQLVERCPLCRPA